MVAALPGAAIPAFCLKNGECPSLGGGRHSPRLIVQVKSSPSPVDVKVVRELNGVLRTQNANQGPLVAWGGLNKIAWP